MMLVKKDWTPGTRLRLIDYTGIDPSYRSHLLSLGFTQGVVITVVRSAPFGGPIQIELRGVMLGLRREDLQALHWEPCDE